MPAETTIGEAFAENTGRDPFRLPPSWLAARPALDMTTPLDLVATVDAVGGNSGSPLVDRDGNLVGLVFATTMPARPARSATTTPKPGRSR